MGKKEAFCEELEAQVTEMFAKRARTNAGRRCKDGRQRSRKWTCERGGKAAGEKSRLPGRRVILIEVEHCEGQCFNLSVDLVFDHSHEVESTTAWNCLEVEESARLRLIEPFEEGLTPSRAKKAFEEELMAKYGDDWLEVSAKRSINPDTNYISNLHTKFWKNRFVSINGPDAYQRAKEFIEDYNRKSKSKIASITQLESGSVVVAVVYEFSKRVHKSIVQSGQICFLDGSSSLDRMNHQLI